ncbi:MAG TPA: choice-of-anchor tandem repeat GloVer-containing protein, partial [Bacteroidia bacterium]|nr:choice-of-anchor tandem repeat GloVer-containing protein [Bacteroidia bacterium]
MKKQYSFATLFNSMLKGKFLLSLVIIVILSFNANAQLSILGVTEFGGGGNTGIMFQIDTTVSANYTTLHNFLAASGDKPMGSLTEGTDGNIYGITSTGGSAGDSGTIFSFNLQTLTYTALYNLSKAGGFSPSGSLVQAGGNFYGMTHLGGANDKGAIFEFNPVTKVYTDIHDFVLSTGISPYGSLTFYNGVLYGMTYLGGAKDSGVIFSIDTATKTYSDVVDLNRTTGGLPFGNIIITPANNFLALTSAGGAHDSGSVLLFDPVGKTVTDVYDFRKSSGSSPFGQLIWGGSKLYGLTESGGLHDSGTIFSLDPVSYAYTKLFDFTNSQGYEPFGSLMLAENGDLYGMTTFGGAHKDGVIFRMDTTTHTYKKIMDLSGGGATGTGKTPYFTQLFQLCVPPHIIQNATNAKVCAGTDTSFTIIAAAGTGATITYQWEVNKGAGYNNITNTGVYSGATTQSLKVTDATLAMNGYTYRCVTTTGCIDSTLTTVDTLTVNGFTVSISDNVIGGASVCTGTADTLTATATGGVMPYTYKWTTGSVSDTSLIHATGTFKVIIKDKNGCADSASQAVTVNPDPVITITSSPVNDTVCKGSNVTLSGNGAVSYNWNNGITNALAFTPAASSEYVVTGTDANGCKGKDSVEVIVDTVMVSLTGNKVSGFSICGASNDTVTAVTTSGIGKLMYAWSTTGTKDSIIVNSAGTYSVTVTDAKGCTGIASAVVTSQSIPTITITSNPVNDTVCAGSPITLSGNGASTYKWNKGVTDGVAFTPSVSGTNYVVTGTDVNGCQAKDSVIVGIRTLPTVSIASTPANDTVCKGSSVTLNATGNALAYTWNNGITNNTPFIPVASGKYIAMGNDAYGCIGKDSVNVTVDTVMVVLHGNKVGGFNICGGGNDTITATTASSIGKLTYMWSTTGTQDSIIEHAAGTYSVTITDAKGCQGIGSATVAISSNPTITITSNPANDTVCAGSTIMLSGNGGVSYTWNNGVTNGVAFAPSVSGTKYIVTGTNASGCQAKDSVLVGIRTLPGLTITSSPVNDTVCKGSPVTLSGSGATIVSYSWNNGITNGTPFSPAASAKYIVTGTDKYGCNGKDSVNVTVDTVIVSLTGNKVSGYTICGGGNDTITATTTSSIGKLTYQWNTTGTKDSIIVHGAGTFSVTVTDAKACKGIATATVITSATPTITVTSSPVNDTVCKGSTITLSGNGGVSYTWSNGVSNGVAFAPAVTGTKYIVTGTNASGCKAKDSVVVGVRNLPALNITSTPAGDTVCKSSPITLTATGALTYSWTNGITNAVAFTPPASGKYIVTGTDKYGCINKDSANVGIDTVMVVLKGNKVSGFSICNHGNDTIMATTTSSLGKLTYVWNTTGTKDSVIAHTGGTYSVTVTDAKGCKGIGTATVTLAASPTITVTGNPANDSICGGNSVTLTANGAVSYSWNNGVTNGVPFSPGASGKYIVTGTGADGCKATDTVKVGVTPAPVITVTGQSTIVKGTADTLTASGATSYVWSTGSKYDTTMVKPIVTTTYTVVGTT